MNPIPRWVNWLAAIAIFAGYGLLEWQDADTERRIAEAAQSPAIIAEAPRK